MLADQSWPVNVADFMSAVLYGDDGFYMNDAVRAGRGGDFVTSPELGSAFARAIASELEPGMRVADVGGGRGTLAAALHEHAGVEAAVVEISPAARAAAEAQGLIVAATLTDLPWRPDVVVANELLDNLPARLVSHAGELVIGPGEGGLEWYRVALDKAAQAFVDRYVPDDELGCGIVPFPVTAIDWLREVDADRLILFDYGATAAELAARDDWPLRGYAGHRRVDPLDALELGIDVTVEVPIDAVRDVLVEAGWNVRRQTQAEWVHARGAGDRSALGSAETAALLDPSGIGGFVVIDAL